MVSLSNHAPEQVEASALPSGFAPLAPVFKVKGYNFPKRRLVAALSEGLLDRIVSERLLEARGIRPSYVAGHSLGEYSAHVAAGTLTFADAIRTVRRRGRYMQEAVPVGSGAMAAILGLDGDTVARACAEAAEGDVVAPANLNAPGQVVIAGTAAGVARAGERARARGAPVQSAEP